MAGSGMEMVPPLDELLAERKAPGK